MALRDALLLNKINTYKINIHYRIRDWIVGLLDYNYCYTLNVEFASGQVKLCPAAVYWMNGRTLMNEKKDSYTFADYDLCILYL